MAGYGLLSGGVSVVESPDVIDWRRPLRSVAYVAATLPDGTSEPGQEMLEVFSGSTPLMIGHRLTDGVGYRDDAACPLTVLYYDLRDLPPGEYTLVHRQSSAPADLPLLGPTFPWRDFEGEPALTTALVIDAPVLDGGP